MTDLKYSNPFNLYIWLTQKSLLLVLDARKTMLSKLHIAVIKSLREFIDRLHTFLYFNNSLPASFSLPPNNLFISYTHLILIRLVILTFFPDLIVVSCILHQNLTAQKIRHFRSDSEILIYQLSSKYFIPDDILCCWRNCQSLRHLENNSCRFHVFLPLNMNLISSIHL